MKKPGWLNNNFTREMIEELIDKFLSNRSSGANQLAKNEIAIIQKFLVANRSPDGIREFITQASKKFP